MALDEYAFLKEMEEEEDVHLIQFLSKGHQSAALHPREEINDDDSDYDVPLARLKFSREDGRS